MIRAEIIGQIAQGYLASGMSRNQAAIATLNECMFAWRAGGRLIEQSHRDNDGIKRVTEFTTSSDFPQSLDNVIAQFDEFKDVSLAYEALFGIRDLRTTPTDNISLDTVSHGLTFRKVLPGDRVEVYGVSGARIFAPIDQYMGAIGWDINWMRDNQWWKVTEMGTALVTEYFDIRSVVLWTLISAARPDDDYAWQGVTADSDVVRDIKTLNGAAVALLVANKDKGFQISPSTTFVISCPIQLRDRIDKALKVTNLETSAAAGGPESVNWNFELNVTDELRNQAGTALETIQYLVSIPGRKWVLGYRQDLEVDTETDIRSKSEVIAGNGRFGAIIGDVDQALRCATEEP